MSSKSKHRVTLHDIARSAGVSHVTVSNALRGSSLVRPETREKVERVAAKMGYRPNLAARTTRTGRFDAIALLLPANRSAYLPETTLDALLACLAERGVHLTVEALPPEELADDVRVPKLLRELACDGMIVNYLDDVPARMTPIIEQYALPTVFLNTKRDHDCVRPDDLAAGERCTRELLRRGHRRVAYVTGQPGSRRHYSHTDRQAGYEQAMRDAGLEPRVCTFKHTPYHSRGVEGDTRLAWCRALLDSSDRPTGIVTNAPTIHGPLTHTILHLGLELAADLSVITISSGIADEVGVPLHTLSLDHGGAGQAAGEMILQKIKLPTEPIPTRLIPLYWRPGVSLGSPRPDR